MFGKLIAWQTHSTQAVQEQQVHAVVLPACWLALAWEFGTCCAAMHVLTAK